MCRQPTEQCPYQPAQPVAVEDRAELLDVLAEHRRIDRRVLDERGRPPPPSLAAISSPSPALRTLVSASCSAAVSARSVW